MTTRLHSQSRWLAASEAQGEYRAKNDFQNGAVQLYFMVDPGSLTNHASNEGAFKLMDFGYNPIEGYPGRYAAETFLNYYNREMRKMHEHPERIASSTNGR